MSAKQLAFLISIYFIHNEIMLIDFTLRPLHPKDDHETLPLWACPLKRETFVAMLIPLTSFGTT
jgi:hypothetical protein